MSLVLVTGGCGFIGTNLVRALVNSSHSVRVLDSLAYGSRAGMPPGVETLRGSVGDAGLLVEAFQDADFCIHLAGTTVLDDPRSHVADRVAPFLAAVEPLFAAAARARVPVIYASSAAVYGEGAELPLREMAPRHPVTAHGVEKLALEICAAQYAERADLPSLGMRMFNVYGPGQLLDSPYCGVVRRFADTVLKGEEAVIYGDGSHTRDFIYIDDVIDCILRAMKAPLAGADVVNICTGQPVSILDLVKVIEAEAGKKLAIRFEKDPETDVPSSVGDPTKARETLDFTPRTQIEGGVRRLLRHIEAGCVSSG